MKIVGDFNNVSQELKPKPLKRGEVATYRLLTGRPDPSRPGPDGRPTMSYGKAVRIPTRDRIWDPYKESFVDIGVVQEFEKDNVTRTRRYYATAGGDFENPGIFQFSGNSNEDAEFYEFFEMSNYNKSFEHRDPSVEPMFERVDFSKENEKKSKIVHVKADALIRATSMNLSEMRTFAAQMGWNEMGAEDEVKAQVLTYAEQNPQMFLKMLDDEQGATRSVIKQATTLDIVRYDPAQHRYVWGKTEQTIATLDRIDGKSHLEIFADWLITSKNGLSIKNKIEQQVRGNRKGKLGGDKEGAAE